VANLDTRSTGEGTTTGGINTIDSNSEDEDGNNDNNNNYNNISNSSSSKAAIAGSNWADKVISKFYGPGIYLSI
jgi:hypothetical protein